ncbi:MAG: hypothetical protein WCJ97_03210 [Phycisphaerae bacterium]
MNLKPTRVGALLVLGLALTLPLSAQNARGLPAEFETLASKSIFAKDRSSRRSGRNNNENTTIPVRTRAQPILIGVLHDDQGYVAYIEDPELGKTSSVRLGEALPLDAGTVYDLTLDALIIKGGTETAPVLRRIAVGQTLAGTAPPIVAAAPAVATSDTTTTTQPGTTSATPSTPPVTSGGGDIIEQMRRRRLKELGK